MTMVHYTARVEKNGSLTLPKEAQEALNLQPGDEIRIQVEAESMEQERVELRHALDIGLEQLERGDYSVYSADTIQELFKEVRAEGQMRLDQTREKRVR
jgi:AbrB family looped-hinge helix DNA binding protein